MEVSFATLILVCLIMCTWCHLTGSNFFFYINFCAVRFGSDSCYFPFSYRTHKSSLASQMSWPSECWHQLHIAFLSSALRHVYGSALICLIFPRICPLALLLRVPWKLRWLWYTDGRTLTEIDWRTCTSITSYTTNLTCTHPVSETGFRGDRPATSRLCLGTALNAGIYLNYIHI